MKMRIVGKEKTATTDEERWNAGIKASELVESLGLPNFRQRGVYRGPQRFFDQMDEQRLKLRQAWINEHSA